MKFKMIDEGTIIASRGFFGKKAKLVAGERYTLIIGTLEYDTVWHYESGDKLDSDLLTELYSFLDARRRNRNWK